MRREQQLTLFGDAGEPPGRDRSPHGVAPAAVADELRALAARLPTTLHLGTSSWSFPGWAGIVYDGAASTTALARRGLMPAPAAQCRVRRDPRRARPGGALDARSRPGVRRRARALPPLRSPRCRGPGNPHRARGDLPRRCAAPAAGVHRHQQQGRRLSPALGVQARRRDRRRRRPCRERSIASRAGAFCAGAGPS